MPGTVTTCLKYSLHNYSKTQKLKTLCIIHVLHDYSFPFYTNLKFNIKNYKKARSNQIILKENYSWGRTYILKKV